jgi:hypothetical protein
MLVIFSLPVYWVLLFRDYSFLGFSSNWWQAIIAIPYIVFNLSNFKPAQLQLIIWLASILFVATIHSLISYFSTNLFWFGILSDGLFAAGMAAYLGNPSVVSQFKKTGYWVGLAYATYVVIEKIIGPESLVLLHKTEYTADGRSRGFFSEPSFLQGVLLPVLLDQIIRSKGIRRNVMVLAAVFTTVSVNSLSGHIALVGSTITVAILRSKMLRLSAIKIAYISLTVVVAGTILVVSLGLSGIVLDAYHLFMGGIDRGEMGSFETRLTSSLSGLIFMFTDPNAIFGAGLHGFSQILYEKMNEWLFTTPEIEYYHGTNPDLITTKTFFGNYCCQFGWFGLFLLLGLIGFGLRGFKNSCARWPLLYVLISGLVSEGWPILTMLVILNLLGSDDGVEWRCRVEIHTAGAAV